MRLNPINRYKQPVFAGLLLLSLLLTLSAIFSSSNAANLKALSREAQADAKRFQNNSTSINTLKDMEGVKDLQSLALDSSDRAELEGLASKCTNAGCEALGQHAATQLQDNESFSELNELHRVAATREKIDFDGDSDPIFRAEKLLMEKEENEDAPIVNEYQDCWIEKKQTEDTFTDYLSCISWAVAEDVDCKRWVEYDCSRKVAASLEVTSSSSFPLSYNEDTGYLRVGNSSKQYEAKKQEKEDDDEDSAVEEEDKDAEETQTFTAVFNVENATEVIDFRMVDRLFNREASISINGRQVSLDTNVASYLRTGSNSISVSLTFLKKGYGWFEFNFKATSCYKNTDGQCSDYISKLPSHQCEILEEVCTQGAETRNIQGYRFYNDCWAYDSSYNCYLGKMEDEEECSEIEAAQCSHKNDECLEYFADGVTCMDKEKQYICSHGDGTVEDELVCSGGFSSDIFDVNTDYEKSEDFEQAISTLAMVDAMAQDIGAKFEEGFELGVFTGESYKCTTASISTGGINCCPRARIENNGSVSKVSVKYGNKYICNLKEKDYEMGVKVVKKHCIDLGRYCDKRTLRVCIRYKRSHCCFDGTLARILQEQGKKQLGLGHGSRKRPNCRAFTPAELERIDWNQIDLTDFYDEVMENFNPPDESALAEQLQNRVQGILPNAPRQ